MKNILVSFLGLGNPRNTQGYDEVLYCWPGVGRDPIKANFAQTVILAYLAQNETQKIQKCLLFCTEQSHRAHLQLLQEEIEKHLGGDVPEIRVPEPLVPTEMTAENQWGWFEQLLLEVNEGDRLTIDFTHGMRAVPIVFSSAIGFLQRAKGVVLEHALYAWFDQNRQPQEAHPIIDMRDFFMINDWTESISRLIDDADVKKLATLTNSDQLPPQLSVLNSKELVVAMDTMTDAIRNVEINAISTKVHNALEQLEKVRHSANGSARLMLDLVWKKFSGLAFDHPPSGRYDEPYFQTQIKIIEVLLEHRLYMQAFTAMREMVASLGMSSLTGKYRKPMDGNKGRKYRKTFAEAFFGMMGSDKSKWKDFNPRERDQLLPFCHRLEDIGQLDNLQKYANKIRDIRNGFDHGWTSKQEVDRDVEQKGRTCLEYLQELVNLLVQHNLLQRREVD